MFDTPDIIFLRLLIISFNLVHVSILFWNLIHVPIKSHSNFNSNIFRLDLIFLQHLEFCLHHHPTCFPPLLHFVFPSFWRLLVAQFCKCAHIRDIRGAFSARYAEADIYGQTFAHDRHEPDLRHITNIYSLHMWRLYQKNLYIAAFSCVFVFRFAGMRGNIWNILTRRFTVSALIRVIGGKVDASSWICSWKYEKYKSTIG